MRSQTPGPCLNVDLKFIDSNNNPINDLMVNIWHASPVGLYENQDDSQTEYNLRGKFCTGTDGKVKLGQLSQLDTQSQLIRPLVNC